MTGEPKRRASISKLLHALKWVKTVAAFKQKSMLPDDAPGSPGYVPLAQKKQQGRPASQSTLKMQNLRASRPTHAKHIGPRESELLNALRNYWQVLRENQGLHSKTISDSFALEVISMDEEQFEASISGQATDPIRKAHHSKIIEELRVIKKRVSDSAREAGSTPSRETGRDRLRQVAPKLLGELANGSLRYKAAERQLQRLKADLKLDVVPSERTLRRWAEQEKSDTNAQKK